MFASNMGHSAHRVKWPVRFFLDYMFRLEATIAFPDTYRADSMFEPSQ